MFFKPERPFSEVTRRERRGSYAWIFLGLAGLVGVRLYRHAQQPAPLQVEITWLAANQAPQEQAEPEAIATSTLFAFDPNGLPLEQWQALGLSRKQAESIHKFERAGGQFNCPEDVARLYVVSDALFARWEPYLRFPSQPAEVPAVSQSEVPRQTHPEELRQTPAPEQLEIVDLNTADTAALAALPGIGRYTARRLLWFRRDLGGYRTLQQVQEVPGIRKENLEKALPFLKVASRLNRRDLNGVDANTLGHHPYMSWNQARAIVAFREQHGSFAGWEEVLEVALVSPEDTARWAPYFQFRP